MTHTPGPWRAVIGFSEQHINSEYDGLRVRVCNLPNVYNKADAPLIAAAPDMLAACKMFTEGARDAVRALNDAGLPCPSSIALAAEKARAAIDKAEGTS